MPGPEAGGPLAGHQRHIGGRLVDGRVGARFAERGRAEACGGVGHGVRGMRPDRSGAGRSPGVRSKAWPMVAEYVEWSGGGFPTVRA